MYFVLKATESGKHMAITIEPDWDHACHAGIPNVMEPTPGEIPDPAARAEFKKNCAELAEGQSIVLIFNGPKAIENFAMKMNDAPHPWDNYAAALCHIAEQAGLVAEPWIWMPRFYETNYGKMMQSQRMMEAN